MFASVDGVNPGYTAFAPHILAPRHAFVPSIPGNNLPTQPKTLLSRPFSAEALDRMDGGFPEWMAKSPSTLRYA